MTRLIVSHPTGNANVRAALEAFEGAGMLEAFYTGIGIGIDSRSALISRMLARRRFPIPSKKLHALAPREFVRLLSQQLGLRFGYRHETGALCIDRVYHDLDSATARRLLRAKNPPDAVYCYEDGAYESFLAAAERRITRIYDLPIGYWRVALRIQLEEAELKPEWASTMPALLDSTEKLERKDSELRSADAIIVASQFTARTLEDTPFPTPQPLVIPYGCPTHPLDERLDSAIDRRKSPLRVLYVGSLSQRKGLSYLFDAVKKADCSVELTLVGKRVAECAPIDEAIRSNRWIESAPHDSILSLMRQHDVLVFPSLFEGFGLVVTEALSQGIPVITTSHTCGPDVISEGTDGFIVPIRSADAIAEKLNQLASDRDRLDAMKESALLKARSLTWLRYRQALVSSVASICDLPNGH